METVLWLDDSTAELDHREPLCDTTECGAGQPGQSRALGRLAVYARRGGERERERRWVPHQFQQQLGLLSMAEIVQKYRYEQIWWTRLIHINNASTALL